LVDELGGNGDRPRRQGQGTGSACRGRRLDWAEEPKPKDQGGDRARSSGSASAAAGSRVRHRGPLLCAAIHRRARSVWSEPATPFVARVASGAGGISSPSRVAEQRTATVGQGPYSVLILACLRARQPAQGRLGAGAAQPDPGQVPGSSGCSW
jgi:hypothetical protein